MINNRQQNGRRRGRGNNQRPQGGNSGGGGNRNQDNGNRIDNRARGNAAQLLEKYKTLARDAQQAGDRVLTEYYNQFADHYFRVLADTRQRYEENQPRRESRYEGDEQDFDNDDNFGGEPGDEDDNGPQQQQRDQRPDRDYQRDDRNGQRDGQRDNGQRDNGSDRGNGRGDPREGNDRNMSGERGQENRSQENRERYQRPRNDAQRTDAPRRDRGVEANSDDREPRDNGARGEARDPVAAPRPARQPRPPRDESDTASLGFALPPAINAAPEVPTVADADAAPVKRRGRPRKVVTEAAIEG